MPPGRDSCGDYAGVSQSHSFVVSISVQLLAHHHGWEATVLPVSKPWRGGGKGVGVGGGGGGGYRFAMKTRRVMRRWEQSREALRGLGGRSR